MNIAVLSDIHGNHVALETCLNYLKDKNIDAYCFLGDYTGEFPGIEQTLKMLYDLRENNQCYFLRGNKENYQIDELGEANPEVDEYPSTIGLLRYANQHLTKSDLEFFNSLPITMTVENAGLPDIVICHGSPRKVNEKFAINQQNLNEVITELDADYIVCGHTHKKMEMKYGTKHIWNPGSVGASIDAPYRYRFMILHGYSGQWTPEYIALEADIKHLVNELHESGLFEVAPYWTRFTELMITDKCGGFTHGDMLNRAMEICREQNGECNWPMVPEQCYAKAFDEIVEFYG